MPLILHHSGDLPGPDAYDRWLAFGPVSGKLPQPKFVDDFEQRLERSFKASIEQWFEIARQLGQDPSSVLGHTASCAANSSDLGVMLAFTAIADELVHQPRTILAVCDDPWLFRHLCERPGVSAGRKPGLWMREVRLWCRGLLSRTRAAVRVGLSAIRLGRLRRTVPLNASYLMVYGHPGSTAEGYDGYFSGLMRDLPELKRMMHVDCAMDWAMHLARDGRTFSLHSYGQPLFAFRLPFAKWRPGGTARVREWRWLIRRAVVRDGGTGSGAMIAWQLHCQRRWLRLARPAVVAWPWENHGWERQFVRDARAVGVRTVGYQHGSVGLQINQSPRSAPDGEACLPDEILCNGLSGLDQLCAYRVPVNRLTIAGSLRIPNVSPPPYDPTAPVFVAVPFDSTIGRQMIEACRAIPGRRFVIKQHPMFPYAFEADEVVKETDIPLSAQSAVSAVVFAATTVGLEAWLGGLPTIRFLPSDRIALDILPPMTSVTVASARDLADGLERTRPHVRPLIEDFFAPVDLDVWRGKLLPPRSN